MLFYLWMLTACVVVIIYSIEKIEKNKKGFYILCIAFAVIFFTNASIQIVKILLFVFGKLFADTVYLIARFENAINKTSYILLAILIIYALIKLIILKKNERKKELSINMKIKSIIIVTIVFSLLLYTAQFVCYVNTFDNYTKVDFEHIQIENKTEEDMSDFIATMNYIYEKNEDYFVENSFQCIYKGDGVQFIGTDYENFQSMSDGNDFYYKYFDTHKPYKEDEYSRTFWDSYVVYEQGNYQVFELEYTYMDGRNFSKSYTVILYGTTISDEEVVCVHNIIDTYSLTCTPFEKTQKERVHQYYYEILD